MQRAAFEDLAAWKESPDRKPLVIRGARQVGKTWLMRQFGRDCYKSVAYFKEIPQESPVFIQGRNAALKPRRYFFERQATNR